LKCEDAVVNLELIGMTMATVKIDCNAFMPYKVLNKSWRKLKTGFPSDLNALLGLANTMYLTKFLADPYKVGGGSHDKPSGTSGIDHVPQCQRKLPKDECKYLFEFSDKLNPNIYLKIFFTNVQSQ